MSGSKKPVLIAWDSCVWLAWFSAERDKPLESIRDALRESEDGKSTLLMSAVCLAEVIDLVKSPDSGTKIRAYAKRKNVFPANLDFRISQKASEIRKWTIEANERGEQLKKVKTPDALIAATAIIYKATVLHTFDDGLLQLSEKPVVDGLKIQWPKPLRVTQNVRGLFDAEQATAEHKAGRQAEADQPVSNDTRGSTPEGDGTAHPEGTGATGTREAK